MLTITVFAAVTVFAPEDEADTVYRYDLPASSYEAEGAAGRWAAQEAAGQAREMLIEAGLAEPRLPGAEAQDAAGGDYDLAVEAAPEVREAILAELRGAAGAEPLTQGLSKAPGPDSSSALGTTRRGIFAGRKENDKDSTGGAAGEERWAQWKLHAVLAVGFIVIVAGCWLAAAGLVGPSADEVAEGTSREKTNDLARSSGSGGEQSGAVAGGPARADDAAAQPPVVVHSFGLISLTTPAGFSGEADGGDVILRGEDENLRIHASADPIFDIPVEAVVAEVKDTIAADPALEFTGEEAGRIRYVERPGDGSEVLWETWVADRHQLSVGCQTRSPATVPQRAACGIVSESLGIHG